LLENTTRDKRISLFNNGSEVDLYTDTNRLSLRSSGHDCLINWLAGDGNVGVGTGSPTQKLHVGGAFAVVEGLGREQAYLGGDGIGNDVQFGSLNASVTQATFWNAASNTTMKIGAAAFVVTSDLALKTDVRQLKDALALVQKMRGVRFKWRSDTTTPKRDEVGLIAQEVAAILPEAVGTVRGHAGVSLNSLIPLLVEAVKELATKQTVLEAELAELKNPAATPPPNNATKSRKPQGSA
jgi:hypothetical protein